MSKAYEQVYAAFALGFPGSGRVFSITDEHFARLVVEKYPGDLLKRLAGRSDNSPARWEMLYQEVRRRIGEGEAHDTEETFRRVVNSGYLDNRLDELLAFGLEVAQESWYNNWCLKWVADKPLTKAQAKTLIESYALDDDWAKLASKEVVGETEWEVMFGRIAANTTMSETRRIPIVIYLWTHIILNPENQERERWMERMIAAASESQDDIEKGHSFLVRTNVAHQLLMSKGIPAGLDVDKLLVWIMAPEALTEGGDINDWSEELWDRLGKSSYAFFTAAPS